MTAALTISPAAERMRRSRQRKLDGLRSLTIELRETEVDALVERGFLEAKNRNGANAIVKALYDFFDHTLTRM